MTEFSDFSSSGDCDRGRFIVTTDDPILVTGGNGFIGSKVVQTLLSYGFTRVRLLTRPTSESTKLVQMIAQFDEVSVDIVKGNLLSREDCAAAAKGATVVYHLAAGVEKSFPGCFLNSVVTTRNLLDALLAAGTLKRFVNISSFALYSNRKLPRGGLLDESCEVDNELVERFDPYAYGKAEQDKIVLEYAAKTRLPYVIVRPGLVIGPGKAKIPGRVGIDSLGVFLQPGPSNRMPFTYVDNCAEAIVLAGLKKGIEGEVINIVDDNLPSSRQFLRMYKRQVGNFFSVPLPYSLFYLFNYAWEQYSKWSDGQLPPVFNRKMCAIYYKGNTYSNRKVKELLGWRPMVPMNEGLKRYFDYARQVRGGR